MPGYVAFILVSLLILAALPSFGASNADLREPLLFAPARPKLIKILAFSVRSTKFLAQYFGSVAFDFVTYFFPIWFRRVLRDVSQRLVKPFFSGGS